EAPALSAPLLRVREVILRERDVRLRLPFRFGAVTLTEATEAYARVRVTLEDGRSAWGQAAEMLAPKWFDKDPALSNADNAEQLHIRHTVGLVDPITAADRRERVGDGLPETLEEVVAAYGHAYFKLKVAGDPVADVARLGAIAAVLDRLAEPYHVTLDGNEQY